MSRYALNLQDKAVWQQSEPRNTGVAPRLRVMQKYFLIAMDIGTLLAGIVLGLAFNGLTVSHATFGVVLGIIPIMVICASYFGAYDNPVLVNYSRSIGSYVQGILAAVSIGLLFLFAVKNTEEISRLSLSIALASGAAMSMAVRAMLVSRNHRESGVLVERVIVFEHDAAIPRSRSYQRVNVSHIDIAKALDHPDQLQEISQLVHGMDRVVVACSRKHRKAWTKVLRSLDTQGEIYDPKLNDLGIVGTADLQGSRTFVVSPTALNLRQRIVKRLFDIVVASVAILLLSPVLLGAALAILIEDGRPIFFHQRRIGRGSRAFDIFKFRSMAHGRSDHAAAKLTRRDDDRVTKTGRFIRRTSIDELPQLLNVLLGHMSVVGPRPHAAMARVQDRLYWEIDPRYWERHQIKPGMTGLAQVRGHRGATDEDQHLTDRVAADMEYLVSWSLMRDIKILFATLRVVVHPNAY